MGTITSRCTTAPRNSTAVVLIPASVVYPQPLPPRVLKPRPNAGAAAGACTSRSETLAQWQHRRSDHIGFAGTCDWREPAQRALAPRAPKRAPNGSIASAITSALHVLAFVASERSEQLHRAHRNARPMAASPQRSHRLCRYLRLARASAASNCTARTETLAQWQHRHSDHIGFAGTCVWRERAQRAMRRSAAAIHRRTMLLSLQNNYPVRGPARWT